MIRDYFFKLKKELKKKKYHIVPACPICGSNMTGYYKLSMQLKTDEHEEIIDSMKKGEFIKIVTSAPDNNCFCLECDTQWYTPIKEVRLETKELEEYKKSKGIDAKFINTYINEINSLWKTKNKRKGVKRKAILNFIKKRINKKIKNSFLYSHIDSFEKLNGYKDKTKEDKEDNIK